jgi:hypothetical protein
MAEVACAVHAYHSPRPQESDLHHVVPLSWGGPDDDENVIPICQTGHANIHRLLTAMRRGNGFVAWEIRRQFGPGERRMAQRGFDSWKVGV